MTEALSSVLKIRPGEEIRVLQFVALFLLIQAGAAIGITTSDSLYLLTVGAANLPKVYILVPVVMLLYIPLSTFLTGKLGLVRVFSLTLFTLVGGGVIFWLLIGVSEGSEWKVPILYAAKIYAAWAYISVYSLSWNFTYEYFNILEGKRLFAFFTGGSALGAILGGILINLLTGLIPVSGLYLVWAALALAAVPVFTWICRTQKMIESEHFEEESEGTIFEQAFRLGRIIRGSRFVLILLAVLICAQVLTTLNEYQYLDIFSREYQDEAELASLFGKLYIGVNIFNLIVSTFVFNRLVLRFGVRNIALVLPVVYTLVFCWLFLNYGLLAGFFGFFAYQGLMTAIDFDNTNLILNALPSEGKARVRTFIEGLTEPLATAVAGLFLLSAGTSLDRDTISLIGIFGAGLFLLLVLLLRHNYVGAMVSNLRKGWLDFSRDSEALVSSLGPEDQAFLRRQASSHDPDMAPTAIGILWLNDQASSADALMDFMAQVGAKDRGKAEPLFALLLRAKDAGLFRRILEWLDRDQARIDNDLIQEICVSGLPQNKYLPRLVKSPGPGERATAALQLLKSWKLDERSQGLEIFEQLLGQEEGAAAAIHAIGRTGDERYAHFVAPYLTNSDPEVRDEALSAVNRLVTRESGRLLPPLLEVIRTGDAENRRRAMDALVRIGDVRSVSPLLMLASTFSASDRRQAEAILDSVGLRGVPVAVAVLRARNFPFRGRAVAARALGKLAFAQFEDTYPDLIRPELELAYRSLYRFEILSKVAGDKPGIDVLRRLFLDARMRVVDFILELLSIGGRLPNFELIIASLRSANSKERGNAIETIEQGLSQELFRTLLPLIDSRPMEERIAFYVDHFSPAEPTPGEIVTDALNSGFPLGSAVAAQALWDLHGKACVGQLRERIKTSDFGEFHTMVLALMGVDSNGLNLVERIHGLVQIPLFEPFGVVPLERIVRNASEERFAPGESIYQAGEAADELLFLIDGRVRLGAGEAGPGEVFGEECLFGGKRTTDAVSEAAHVLRISRESVFNTVNIFPEIAVMLLDFSKHRRAK